jgi:hypothetical protein
MKRLLVIIIILISQSVLFGQTQQDSATIIIKNVSKYKFTKYLVAIKGQTAGGLNLKPGQSSKFKIANSDNKLYRFTVYLDKQCQDKYDIPPIDYFSQVSEMEINAGTYTYLIDIDKKDVALLVKLVKTEFSFGQKSPYLDSLDNANQKFINSSAQQKTKLHIAKRDSSLDLKANIRLDHRIFGYSQPNTKSKRLFLLSVFTSDVEKNPFNCDLGAYYETNEINKFSLKYQTSTKYFIKVLAVDKDSKSTIMYIDSRWVVFE